MKLITSIDESFTSQLYDQCGISVSCGESDYISRLVWRNTAEGFVFWYILDFTYDIYKVYDYMTLIKIFIKFGPEIFKVNKSIGVYLLYREYYDKEKGTLSDEGFEHLINKIENEIIK